MAFGAKSTYRVHVNIAYQARTCGSSEFSKLQRITSDTSSDSSRACQAGSVTFRTLGALEWGFGISRNTIAGGIGAIEGPESSGVIAVDALVHGRTSTIVACVVAGLAGEVELIILGDAFTLA